MCGENSALAGAEANLEAISVTNTSHVDRVAILEELAHFTVRQLDFFFATPAQFEHGAILGLLRSTDGA